MCIRIHATKGDVEEKPILRKSAFLLLHSVQKRQKQPNFKRTKLSTEVKIMMIMNMMKYYRE